MTNPTPRPSSLLLLALVLVTGVALGWALNDALRAPATATPNPTVVPTERTAAVPTVAPALPTTTPLPPTTPPIPTPEPPTATPARTSAPVIDGYVGHIVAEGETLEQIAVAGGSSAKTIADYNRLNHTSAPGRALIIPRLAGRTSALENTPIMVRRGSSATPWVALTLDAGASAAPTPRMLDALRERRIHITFFLTGKWIAENPELTRRIVAEGHEIGSHTYHHPDLTKMDDATIRDELADTEAALHDVAPDATLRPFFRPPYGAYDERVQRVVQAEGYLPVYWTLDSLDSVGEPKTPAFLLERVTGKLTPEQLHGAIILMHCGSAPSAEALPDILDRFAAMGLEVRPISAVLAG